MSRDLPYDLVETIQLKPCPFCGHTQQAKEWEQRVRLLIGGMDTYVQCGACKSRGFSVPIPSHTDELIPFIQDIDDIFGLSRSPSEWEGHECKLWLAQLAAKFWNSRREPRVTARRRTTLQDANDYLNEINRGGPQLDEEEPQRSRPPAWLFVVLPLVAVGGAIAVIALLTAIFG